jgi:L-fucose isomerase
MVSGAVNPDAWMRIFGVDADHIDQSEILRRAPTMDETKVEGALTWLSENMGSIRYDDGKLTPDSLRMQIRCYMATKELIAERQLDFVGVKCHYDLSEYYVTQCLAAALCNDPYDWDGVKEPIIYSCEADSDGALTMQIMKLVSNQPALFFDFRHYDEAAGVFVFCNCGAMSTWYAARSDDPAKNLKSVSLFPVIPKYGGKGCHVQYIAREGEVTLGRLSRVGEQYKMTLFRGRFRQFPEEKLQETCPVWPHGFVAVDIDPKRLIQDYDSNHVHGIYGNYIEELVKFCELKQIQCEVLR